MSIILKKSKTAGIFSPPSYIKGSATSESKIDKIINEAIEEKIFSTLNIRNKAYVRLVEYFTTFTTCPLTNDKIVASYMLRVKTDIDKGYKNITAREIEISGINLVEFDNYLNIYGAKKSTDINKILETI